LAKTAPVVALQESVFDIGDRLEELLKQARQEAHDGILPASVRARLADTVEVLRSRLVSITERDPRSLFDLDDRLVELLDSADEAAEVGEIPQDLLQEINDYLEAFQTKVDRIAGYWRWQEAVASICGDEAERLSARKRAAERRVNSLKEMLMDFMMSRGLRKLEGDKSTVGLQTNSMPSLVIDDPLQIGECFFERTLRITKTELQELVCQLADGQLRGRLEAVLQDAGWEIDSSALRFAITNGPDISGARLVKGHHVRLR
jgi:Siphovirus Gp157